MSGAVVPCSSCPWRRGATAAEIPHYDHELAERLVDQPDGDGFYPIMACHHSAGDGGEYPCVGYLQSDEGWGNLAVRLGQLDGRFDLVAIGEACGSLELHEVWDDALDALRLSLGDIEAS